MALSEDGFTSNNKWVRTHGEKFWIRKRIEKTVVLKFARV